MQGPPPSQPGTPRCCSAVRWAVAAQADRLYGGPGKAWAGLQFPLDETDVDIEFLMDGSQILQEGTLLGWSAEQIESVARRLRAAPWERLAAHYAPERMFMSFSF
ncbi:DUF1877 family protein [Streptomyces sp. NPDC046931]|uniref:DUF1877 family protein n=1 Tax=Streptomyces sp. NPDC046931 TaxID=3154806 RepID=UPI0033DBE901